MPRGFPHKPRRPGPSAPARPDHGASRLPDPGDLPDAGSANVRISSLPTPVHRKPLPVSAPCIHTFSGSRRLNPRDPLAARVDGRAFLPLHSPPRISLAFRTVTRRASRCIPIDPCRAILHHLRLLLPPLSRTDSRPMNGSESISENPRITPQDLRRSFSRSSTSSGNPASSGAPC